MKFAALRSVKYTVHYKYLAESILKRILKVRDLSLLILYRTYFTSCALLILNYANI